MRGTHTAFRVLEASAHRCNGDKSKAAEVCIAPPTHLGGRVGREDGSRAVGAEARRGGIAAD